MMLIDIADLTKTYNGAGSGGAVEVLRAINWQVAAGDSAAILGRSGSGKSTLLNLIGALDKADRGRLLVDGRDLCQLNEREVAQYRNGAVGFIFQLHHLLPQCTVLENVLVPTLARAGGERKALRARAEYLLESVGLAHRINHRPAEISGGERQRVAVARALIHEPKLLLADEPTGSLDSGSAGMLMDLLLKLNQKQHVTLIVVTHALEVASRMQRVMVIEDGRLLERSRP